MWPILMLASLHLVIDRKKDGLGGRLQHLDSFAREPYKPEESIGPDVVGSKSEASRLNLLKQAFAGHPICINS
jgi:hypothetical protein